MASGKVPPERAYGRLTRHERNCIERMLAQAWASLGDALVDDEGRLFSRWRDYPAGTGREDIWHDFDEACEGGVHSLMFPDPHKGNEPLGRQESDARAVAVTHLTTDRSRIAPENRQCF